MAAARSLDYRPNEVARSMTTGRSRAIGVVVADVENPYFGLAVRGITDVARAEVSMSSSRTPARTSNASETPYACCWASASTG
jgi:DNA-binding LacI/PurR family transcriptional regulator